MDFKVTPQELGQRLGIDWSDEQMAILTSDFQHPMLINAVAGAGKTTTLMSSILFNALNDRILANQVLGITFSRAAATDMEDKYTRMALKARQGTDEAPEFKTFHAFFLGIILSVEPWRQPVQTFKVNQHVKQLYSKISHPIEEMNQIDNIQKILDKKEKLINFGFSDDGIGINENLPEVKSILKLTFDETPLETVMCYLNLYESEQAFKDYLNVVKEYQKLKKEEGTLDFSDMQTIVWHYLQTGKFKDEINDTVKKYKQIYLDEFQDISPLQWNLVRKLFPKSVLNSMVAVGDDDQSIYSFRGSSPEIILDFQKTIPNAKTYHLSTNYRTGSKILATAAPMIELNENRLAKDLNAFNKGGEPIRMKRHDLAISDEDPAMVDLLKQCKKHPDQSFVILTRFNRDLMIVSDWLMSHGIYVNGGKNLNEHPLYKQMLSLADALYNDNVNKLVKFANYINGYDFKNVLANSQKIVQADSINGLLTSDVFKEKASEMKSSYFVYQFAREIRSLTAIFNADDNISAEKVFNGIDKLTKGHYEYCLEKGWISFSRNDYYILKNYLYGLTRGKTWSEFWKIEGQKHQMNSNPKKSIGALTLHRSKGLEWDNVYLYGLSQGMTNSSQLKMYYKFPPKMDYYEFCDQLANADLRWILRTLAFLGVSMESVAACILEYADDVTPTAKDRTALAKEIGSGKETDEITLWKSDEWVLNSLDENAKQMLYHGIMNVSKKVEEERRLLYVGITRAKKRMVIDSFLGDDPSIILESINARSIDARSIDEIKSIQEAINASKDTPLLDELNKDLPFYVADEIE